MPEYDSNNSQTVFSPNKRINFELNVVAALHAIFSTCFVALLVWLKEEVVVGQKNNTTLSYIIPLAPVIAMVMVWTIIYWWRSKAIKRGKLSSLYSIEEQYGMMVKSIEKDIRKAKKNLKSATSEEKILIDEEIKKYRLKVLELNKKKIEQMQLLKTQALKGGDEV